MGMIFRNFLPKLPGVYQAQRPWVKNHQSSRAGIFMCGDLAGEPLLKTSAKDAVDTIDVVDQFVKKNTTLHCDVDVVICGAGAAGIAAAIECEKRGLTTVILEKNKPFQTVIDFPDKKHIYANPQDLEFDSPLNIDDCSKEEFLDFAYQMLQEQQIDIKTGIALKSISGDGKTEPLTVVAESGECFSGKAIVLAMGRRGNPRKLNVIGEDSAHVHHNLLVPHGYENKNTLVVGGGNSAVEAAMALAENGAKVTLSYRKNQFFRASKKNRELLYKHMNNDSVSLLYNSNVQEIRDQEVDIEIEGALKTIAVDDVFILIGAESPNQLMDDLGLKIDNVWNGRRFVMLAISFALVWCFYAFSKWGSGTSIKEFPFSLLGSRYDVLPSVNPGHVKGLIYSVVVTLFAIPAMIRWRSVPRNRGYQTWRYITIILSQTFFLFIFPEFLLTKIDPSHAWRFYGVVMPFPLVYETFFNSSTFWLIACFLATFIVLPIFVYFHGKKLCSWICGCGCLAETLGDSYRHYAPQGDNSRKIEDYLLWPVLIWAFLSAGYYLFVNGNTGPRTVAMDTYSFWIDFVLASVVGVAFYFFWGNRVWCRYFCPLAHYMRLLSAWFGKFRIKSADRCIACGECTYNCQMGIDVMQFALKEEELNNKNSSCIGCGICVSVCPVDNLTTGKTFPNGDPVDE